MSLSASPLDSDQAILVLRLSIGQTVKAIAFEFDVDCKSVSRWLKRAREVAKANTNEQLVAKAIRNGWIS